MKRIMIFIDGSNLYHIIEKERRQIGTNLRLDMKKFINFLTNEDELVQIFYYTAPLDKELNRDKYAAQQRFFSKLKQIKKFNLILCRLQKEKLNGKTIYSVKEDDINLAADMIHLAHLDKYDEAILVTSDGDFVPAVKIVKEIGKNVKNIGFKTRFSWYLKKECTSFKKISQEELKEFLVEK